MNAGTVSRLWARATGPSSIEGRASSFVWTFLLGIGPSVAVHGYAAWLGAERAYLINADYLVLVLVLSIAEPGARQAGWRIAALIVFVLLLAIDLATIYLHAYFLSPQMVVDTLPFARLWPWQSFLLPGAFGLALLLLTAKASARSRVPMSRHAAVVFILSLYAADQGLSRVGGALNLVSSSSQEVLRPAFNHLIDRMQAKPIQLVPIRADTMFARLAAGRTPDRVLSLSVESLGVRVAGEQDWARLSRRIGQDYDLIEAGEHEFDGATMAGELRELCGLRISGVPYAVRELDALSGCAPRLLVRRGYLVRAFHGGDAWFYNRARIYAAAGVERSRFFADLKGGIGRPCAFLLISVCDADLARIALAEFRPGVRMFVHIMTIDTHLPLPAAAEPCSSDVPAQDCALRERMAASLDGIGQAIANAAVKPDLIFVYGDHAPPFVDRQARALYRARQVPFLVYRLRSPAERN